MDRSFFLAVEEELLNNLIGKNGPFWDPRQVKSSVTDITGEEFFLWSAFNYGSGPAGLLGCLDFGGCIREGAIETLTLNMLERFVDHMRGSRSAGQSLARVAYYSLTTDWALERTEFDQARRLALEVVFDDLRRRLSAWEECQETGRCLPGFFLYDVIEGASSSIMLLISRRAPIPEDILQKFFSRAARHLEGSWGPDRQAFVEVSGPPLVPFDDETVKSHLNFSMAHGSNGVALAACALLPAWGGVVRGAPLGDEVEEVLEEHLKWLLKQADADRWLTFKILTNGQGAREARNASWCYGSTGVALLLYNLGCVLHNRAAIEAAKDIVSRLPRFGEQQGWGLCHGECGPAILELLIGSAEGVTTFIDSAEQRLSAVALKFDATSRFGYIHRSSYLAEPVDLPGILDGATGVLTALRLFRSLTDATNDGAAAMGLAIRGAPWIWL